MEIWVAHTRAWNETDEVDTEIIGAFSTRHDAVTAAVAAVKLTDDIHGMSGLVSAFVLDHAARPAAEVVHVVLREGAQDH